MRTAWPYVAVAGLLGFLLGRWSATRNANAGNPRGSFGLLPPTRAASTPGAVSSAASASAPAAVSSAASAVAAPAPYTAGTGLPPVQNVAISSTPKVLITGGGMRPKRVTISTNQPIRIGDSAQISASKGFYIPGNAVPWTMPRALQPQDKLYAVRATATDANVTVLLEPLGAVGAA